MSPLSGFTTTSIMRYTQNDLEDPRFDTRFTTGENIVNIEYVDDVDKNG
jgi:hypothetical protein